jgi:hypothetical protein
MSAITKHRIVIHANDSHLLRNIEVSLDANINDIRSDIVVVAKDADRTTQRTDCANQPAPPRRPIQMPAAKSRFTDSKDSLALLNSYLAFGTFEEIQMDQGQNGPPASKSTDPLSGFDTN